MKSRIMKWVQHVARMGENINSYNILAEKHEGKRPLGRPVHRLKDKIKLDIWETG
jgi:hypothetical protein